MSDQLTRDKHPCSRRYSSPFSPGERPQTYALDRAATGTGLITVMVYKYSIKLNLLPKLILGEAAPLLLLQIHNEDGKNAQNPATFTKLILII
jgi:hypothetical protein